MLLPPPLLFIGVLWGGAWAQDRGTGYRLTVAREVRVPRGLCAWVPCSFSYPRGDRSKAAQVQGHWFRNSVDPLAGAPVATTDPSRGVRPWAAGRFQLVGRPRDGGCSLLLTDARMEDWGYYFFRVEGGTNLRYSFTSNMVFLEVTGPTPEPAIYVPETLEPGRPAWAVCVFPFSSERCPAPTLSWSGPAVPPQDVGGTTRAYVSVLSLTPGRRDHGAALTCRASFPEDGPSSERSVRLAVAYAPDVPVISVSWDSGPALDLQGDSPLLQGRKGQRLRLLCAADSSPPADLSWALGDSVLSWSSPAGPGGLELALPALRPGDEGRYSCRAENKLGLQSRTLSLSVSFVGPQGPLAQSEAPSARLELVPCLSDAPENLTVTVSRANGTVLESLGDGEPLSVLEGQSLRLLCVAHSNPPASLSWSRGPQTLRPSQPSAPGVLELPGVRAEHQGQLVCRAQNALGALSVSLNLSVHYPPRLLGPSCSWEDRGLRCSCSARAWPAPSLRWRLGAGVMEGNHGNASHEVTSRSAGPWTNSSLSLLPAGLSPDLRLSCEARNAHGAQSASVLLLPGAEDKELTAAVQGFSKGAALGAGVTALLGLSLGLAIAKRLRKTRTPEEEAAETPAETPGRTETWRSRLTRRSTILDYINVVPKARGPARDPKATPSSPPSAPPGGANSSPGRKTTPPAPETRDSQQEIHYASLSFPRPRPPGAPEATDTNSEYAEIRFH